MTGKEDRDRTIHTSGHIDSDTTAAHFNVDSQSGRTGGSRGQPLEPGAVLGRYEILECIDNGGMGVVYRARHTALGKTVALKVVSMQLQSDPRAMSRFLREMQAIGRLEPHPHVLNAYDAGDEDGVQYIATELIEGIQLANLISRIGQLSVSEACKIISQAASALEHLRKHNLVHRDIKPSNLMLTRDGTVKVVDMGLALLRDEQAEQITISGEAMGSIDYMAPEQWKDSHSVDWRSDVYSLGCTFYCLLAGRAPYSGRQKGSFARMRAHLDSEFPDIREKRKDIPDEAAKLLEAMVVKDPTRRLTDLDEISEKLDIIASGDLKALVARGFAESELKPRKASRPKPIRVTREDGDAAANVDAATQVELGHHDHGGAKPAATKRALVALLLVGGLLGLIATVHYNRTRNAEGPRQALLSDAGVPDSVAATSQPVEASSQTDTASSQTDTATFPATASKSPAAAAATTVLKESVNCVGHQAKIMDLVFLSPDNRVASVSEDGELCVFDLSSPSEPLLRVPAAERAAVAIAYDANADEFAIATEEGTLQIRSAEDGRLLREEKLINVGLTSLVRIPGASAFAASDWGGNAWRIDVSKSAAKKSLLGSRSEVVYNVDVSADGTRMAWVGRDPRVAVYDFAEQSAVNLEGHDGWVYDVAISPDGERLVTAGHEGFVRIWRCPSGEPLDKFEYTVPQSLDFFPDSRHLAVGGRGGDLQIWDLDSMRMLEEFPLGRSIDSVAVSADGTLVAAGGNDGTLKVWPVSVTPSSRQPDSPQ